MPYKTISIKDTPKNAIHINMYICMYIFPYIHIYIHKCTYTGQGFSELKACIIIQCLIRQFLSRIKIINKAQVFLIKYDPYESPPYWYVYICLCVYMYGYIYTY
jgi:hypothetical protein